MPTHRGDFSASEELQICSWQNFKLSNTIHWHNNHQAKGPSSEMVAISLLLVGQKIASNQFCKHYIIRSCLSVSLLSWSYHSIDNWQLIICKLSGYADHSSGKSLSPLYHPVAQKSTRQGEPFKLPPKKIAVLSSTFFLQRYNQFIISLGIADMCNAIQTLVAHQVGQWTGRCKF